MKQSGPSRWDTAEISRAREEAEFAKNLDFARRAGRFSGMAQAQVAAAFAASPEDFDPPNIIRGEN